MCMYGDVNCNERRLENSNEPVSLPLSFFRSSLSFTRVQGCQFADDIELMELDGGGESTAASRG